MSRCLRQSCNRHDCNGYERAAFTPLRALLCLLVTNLLVGGSAFAAASALSIQSPHIASIGGVYILNAKLVFVVPEATAKAVHDGATLNLSLQIRFDHARHWWLNETIAELEQRYTLIYHGVSERYLVRNANSGAQNSYASFAEAIESLQNVSNLPILDASLLAPDVDNEVNLRASVEVRTIPRALDMLLFWVDDFSLKSDWYTWPLQP